MKVTSTITTNTVANIEWPDNVPLPSAGDSVVIQSGQESIGFKVVRRDYSIGVDSRGGSKATKIIIRGEDIKG